MAELTPDSIGAIVGGLLIGIVSFLVWFGKMSAKKQAPTEPIELAGAVIDNRKADELIDSFYSLRNAVNKNTSQLAHLGENLNGSRAEMRDLTREIVRASPK